MATPDVQAKMGFAPDPRRAPRTGHEGGVAPSITSHAVTTEVDLDALTKSELLELAAERGVEVASRWTKARIIEELS